MIQIMNLRNGEPSQPGDIRIDRRTKFGNPFAMSHEGERDEVIYQFADWLDEREDLVEDLARLNPKRLFCWCAPKACHGEVYVERLGRYLDE